ncbi:MAG: hypothetical protein CL758_07000 [Chloroflexi bacterium]|nr:hypothetical protein [Chloroflexota bacterium]|tara:strand:+ start:22034 stop:22357 length:324 start_codon:yes stop_codon:yes gene_type:complete
MYIIRRTYKAKTGQARKAALLLKKIAEIYTSSGQRGETLIYYNGGTLPCPISELNRVYMQWSSEIIDSPYRDGNKFPNINNIYNEFKELLDESDGPTSWIEFWEEIK